MADHDSGYKLLFSHPQMVEELLRGFVHESWVEDLDYGSLEPAETSFTSDDLRERYGDRVWRLRWRGGERGWLYLYLLLEFQSTPDLFMAVRLLGYVALLLADLVRTKVATPALGLPAVLSIVLYNGKRRWSAPPELASLFRSVPPGTERYLPQLAYLLIDESRLRPEELALPGNRVASLFRLETCAPEDLPELTAELAALLPQEKEPELRQHFTTWLRRLLRRMQPGVTIPQFSDLEEIAMLEETLTEWLNGAERKGRIAGRSEGQVEGRTEGRKEGRQEGEIAGMRQLLLQQLQQRFGALPSGVRRRVRSITSRKELKALAKRVLVAGSLAEMGLGG
ncbi:MAG TPA: Rpn family recombination-promoting nuclease/putative transposase [Thermoanaerobaculia bacterium]|nr:Rpn family recombination-promoting nuclease/putative transposase [Thermoanaerobaculia bacterium]